MTRIEKILYYPLVTLSGGTITLASILVGGVIVVLGFLIAAVVGRMVERILIARGASAAAQFAAGRLTRYALGLVGILVGINSTGLNISAVLAASAVLLVGIGLGLQNIAQNFISGLILLVEQPVRRGDYIRAGDAIGRVEDIGLRATWVVTREEVTVIVPNSQLISSQVINHSRPAAKIRFTVRVGVAYGSDTARVRDVLIRVAEENPRVLRDPRPEVRFDDFGDSSLQFSLLAWVENPRMDRRVASDLRFAIEAAFRKADIEIPFPQRDLHLRSGFEPMTSLRAHQ
jgi:small-conductance mechanosensitive channel